jgi:hypothetical protein
MRKISAARLQPNVESPLRNVNSQLPESISTKGGVAWPAASAITLENADDGELGHHLLQG